jgi:hypothetical protein
VELNTSADELAPAFAEGALLFASDRPGGHGGLDLWRAPYSDGVFGPAEPLPPGINSPADETDPAALGAGDGFLFASNRPHASGTDFDLYLAGSDARGSLEVAALDELNTSADERDPAPSRDRRSLYFASNRPGGVGGFDLWRSVRQDGRWLAPELLSGVNGPPGAPPGRARRLHPLLRRRARGRQRGTSAHVRSAPCSPRRPSLREPARRPPCSRCRIPEALSALDVVTGASAPLVAHILLLLYLQTVHPRGQPLAGGATRKRAGPVFRTARR